MTLPPPPHRPTPSPDFAPGSVTLVGAGPGDPELLTLKAVRAIGAATVLLVDDLVNDAVLAHAHPRARVVHVGKRGGCKSTPQAFIDKLMAMAAREGEVVVRLKGGDPFIFGRGGEELEHLQAQGIPVQVVNGITAGLAGLTTLGVPLTHRDHAHGVVFVTGHAKPGDSGTDWRALAATRARPDSRWSSTWAWRAPRRFRPICCPACRPTPRWPSSSTPRCRNSARPSARWPSSRPPWRAKAWAARP